MIKKYAIILTSLLLAGCIQTTPKESDAIFLDSVHESYAAGEQWMVDNIREKGLFHYIYHPKTDEYPSSNNAIRQLMASRLLAELANETSDLLPLHRKNLSFIMQYWYMEDGDLGYVLYDEKSKLGANAMLLRTLIWSPIYEEYKEEAGQLVRGILSLIDKKGEFYPWLKEPDYEYDKDYLLTFYSGEAILSLVEYYEKTGDADILDVAVRAQDYYIDRYVIHLAENYYPAYVPWHTFSLNKLWKITKNPLYAEAIFVLNNELLKIQDTTNEIGRFYDPDHPEYGSPHASSDGVYTEGLAYAYEIAKLTGNKNHQKLYEDSLQLAVGNLISLQYTKDTAAQYKRPDRAIGALRYSTDRSGIRIDTVQHTLDAYRKILSVY